MGTLYRCRNTGRGADDGVDGSLPEIRGRTGEDDKSERTAEGWKPGGIDKVYCNTHLNENRDTDNRTPLSEERVNKKRESVSVIVGVCALNSFLY